jgi:hypothetical protein
MGFYTPVDDKLRIEFEGELESKQVVLLGSPSAKRINDLKLSVLNSLRDDPNARVSILYAVLRGEEWVSPSLLAVVESAREKYDSSTIEVHPFRNPQDVQGVVELLNGLGLLQEKDAVLPAQVEKYLGGREVLFVRSTMHSGLDSTLQRASINCGSSREKFEELIIPPGKNSNLNGELSAKASGSKILLYVWKGLRTLKPETKRKFSHSIEADSSAKVIALLKKELRNVKL